MGVGANPMSRGMRWNSDVGHVVRMCTVGLCIADVLDAGS